MIVTYFERCRALRHLCLTDAYFNLWSSGVDHDQTTNGSGAVLPFPASRETQGNQIDHPIYQILESADRLMTALSLLRNSYTAMMVGMPLRNAAEILTQADAALRHAENVMGRRPVATTETRDVRQVPQRRLFLFPVILP
jgi:hypothetical protein